MMYGPRNWEQGGGGGVGEVGGCTEPQLLATPNQKKRKNKQKTAARKHFLFLHHIIQQLCIVGLVVDVVFP